MNGPENIDELEDATGLSFQDILSILEDELETYEEGYAPLDFTDDLNRF
jgi:hypothetical protein